jgi:hypothetical protein
MFFSKLRRLLPLCAVMLGLGPASAFASFTITDLICENTSGSTSAYYTNFYCTYSVSGGTGVISSSAWTVTKVNSSTYTRYTSSTWYTGDNCYTGFAGSTSTNVSVTVTATDSSGATATASTSFTCHRPLD